MGDSTTTSGSSSRVIIAAAADVSVLAAVIRIWFAGLTGSVLWTIIVGLLVTLLLSLIIGLLLQRDALGPLMLSASRHCSA